MRIKKRKLPTVFDLKAVGEAIQDTPGALAYWGFQNQPPQLYSPAWNRAKAGVLSSDNYPGVQELTNPGNPFTFTGDDPDGWTVVLEDATNRIQEVGSGQGDGGAGTGSMNVYRTNAGVIARQSVLTIGLRYTVSGTCSYTGGGIVQIKLGTSIIGNINAIGEFTFHGVADTVNFDIRAAANPTDVTFDNISLRLANPLDLDLISVTIGEPGQGNIPYVYDFDAVNDYATFSAPGITALDAIFDGDEMSLMAWASVDNWADAASRAVIRLLDDGSNDMMLNKAAGAGVFRWYGLSGGTTNQVSIGTGSPPGLNMYNMTRSLIADELIAYLNNTQIGATQNGLVAWSGGGFDIAGSLIGAITTAPLWPWGGGMAFAALFDQPITAAQNNNIYEAGR